MGYWLVIRPSPLKMTNGKHWLGGEVIEAIEGQADRNMITGEKDLKDFAVVYVDYLTAEQLAMVRDTEAYRVDKVALKAAVRSSDAAKLDLVYDQNRRNVNSELPRLTTAELLAGLKAKVYHG